MGDTENCIYGPPMLEPIPDCSFAEYIIPIIKSHQEGTIIQEDASTGFAETSREYLTKSLKVCEGLKALGLGQNDVICMMARNSSDAYASVLGILTLGSTVAPMDTELKLMELKHAFGSISKPKAIICEERVVPVVTSALDSIGRKCIIIVLAGSERVKKPYIAFEDLLKVEVDVDGFVPPPVESPSTNLAVIIPTSGSTGTQKGVGITHRNLIFQYLTHEEDWLCSSRSCLVLSHFYWMTCFMSLMIFIKFKGKRFYLTDINPRNVMLSIDKCKPEWIFLTAPLLTKVLKEPDVEKYDFSSVKVMFVGGSLMSQALLELSKKIWKGSPPICNCYGASEVSGPIAKTELGKNSMAVGKACKGSTVKVVDLDTGKALGCNQKGEILVKSEGIVREYVGNRDALKEVVIDGWYHTGDLGYYDEEENIVVVERLKELIKTVKGQVSPTELENAIEMIPEVKEVGIVGMLGDTDDCYLVALVVKKDLHLTEDTVKNFLKGNLADFKIPKYVRFVDKIPRTPIGKIKRRELKELAASLFPS